MNPPAFPTFADYQSALQHPEMAFSSNFLSKGLVESDLWGFPRVRSGGFALTYKINIKEMTWAARCFHRVVRDRAIRYAQICRALDEIKLPFFVPTRYFQHGIIVQGKQFPISILQWVEGESLETYIFHHLQEPDTLVSLGNEFRKVCRQLESHGMAHGDLSHRNILVKSGEIFLIDYDGMFVPSLNGRKSSELGNIHFQHPLRTNTLFNNLLDRFSTIVIYLSIIALTSDPSLWQRFQSGGEGLLFQRSDFLNPDKSRLLKVLEINPLTARFIPRFRQICLSPVESVPSLEEFIVDNSVKTTELSNLLDLKFTEKMQFSVLDALSREIIISSEGKIFTIVGQVSEVFHGHTVHGDDHVFINFGGWQENCFTAVIWGPVLDDMKRLDSSLDTLVGEWISITGLISIRGQRPQIQLEAITDFLLLPSEENAKSLLKRSHKEVNIKKQQEASNFLQSTRNPVHTSNQEKLSNNSEIKNIHLIELFVNQSDPSIEEILNQLYAAERFNKPNNSPPGEKSK